MANQSSGQAGKGRRRERTPPNVAFWLTSVWLLALVGAGVGLTIGADVPASFPYFALGGVALLAPLTLLVAWRAGQPNPAASSAHHIRQLVSAINSLVQEGGLSEGAKRVLHRREERELLRRAIEQDIADEDWDAAMVLVKELAEQFGYRVDAEEFRGRIERARLQTLDRNVVDALAGLDELIRHRQWPEAYAEAARITRLYPESHRVENLRQRVDQARVQYRQELERQFLMAAEGDELDRAMELLKELDHYLTPTEAAPFQEVARGVITKQRDNLGVRFKLAVQDHMWQEAIAVGERIIEEFPKSRMAQEVRDMLPTLQDRVASRAAQRA